MRSKVGTWGGSSAIRLPKMVVETLGLHDGAAVDLQIEKDALVVRPGAPRYMLENLVREAADLTPPEASDDGPMGDEAL